MIRVLLLAVLLPCAVVAAGPPNILLIVSEDNGPELGCYGDPYAKTPNLDRLAEEGVRFENAFTPYSVCSPSRACFLTGMHPVVNGQLGLASHKYEMYREWPTAFSLLKKAGYRTALIGKLHVNPKSAFEPHIDFRAISSANFGRKSLATYAEKAGEFFRSAGETPFFLSINHPDAHFPLIPVAGGYPEDDDLLTGDEVKPLPWVGCDSKRLRDATANYYNCMSRLDSLVGEVFEELAKAGKAENTLILYLGDHGAQFSRGKTSVYDAGTRIPLMVHWPSRVKGGQVRSELVDVTDILPTFLKAAGVEVPEAVTGRALQPLLNGRTVTNWRESLAFITTGSAPSIACLQFAIRTPTHKLIITPPGQGENLSARAYLDHKNAHFIGGCMQEEIGSAPDTVRAAYQRYLEPPEFELYDLREDPFEWVNLADDPDHRPTLEGMLAAYRGWQQEVGDPFADAANIRFWIRQEEESRHTNYRVRKEFRWGYLGKFSGN